MKKNIFLIVLFFVLLIGIGYQAEAKTGNTPLNAMSKGYIGNPCRSGNNIYYSVYNKLYKYNVSSKKNTLVRTFEGFSLSSINIYNKKIIFVINNYMGTGGEISNIYSTNLKGKKLKKLARGSNCTVVNGEVYYLKTKVINSSDWVEGISKMKLNGKKKKMLRKGTASNMAIYRGRIFFNTSNSGIYSMKMDGTNQRIEANGSITGFSGEYIYYSSYNGDSAYIDRKLIGGTEGEYVLSGVYGAAVEGDYIYYVIKKQTAYNKPPNVELYKKNIKTGKTEKIYKGSGLGNPFICGDYLYFNKYLGNERQNFQAVIMNNKGKKVKKLVKCFLS